MAGKVNLDVSERLDITCRRGDTFLISLTFKTASGDLVQLDTLNYKFLMDVKSSPQNNTGRSSSDREIIASSDLSTGVSVADPLLSNAFTFEDITDLGTVNLTANAKAMSVMPLGVFTYDIQQQVGESITTILRGAFKVNEDISG